MIESTLAKEEDMSAVLDMMRKMGHEQVVFCQDEKTGLRAIIAIHSTELGPSLGGTRMWAYKTEAEALKDVLRLSRGMTYKSAISGLDLGGGKAVIIGNSRKDKSRALFERFGEFVDSLGGKYITAEDVGISPDDILAMSSKTKHVTGLPESEGGMGDPSPVTAHGVYMGMKGAAKFAFGSEDLKGRKIAVQGVGHVGASLVEELVKEGAKVTITDIHDDLIKNITDRMDVTVVEPDKIYDVDMDIYAPCALGATVNDTTLERLKCQVIAGAANNQLADETKHGQELLERGIVFAPDYLVNAGGIIYCFAGIAGHNSTWAMNHVEKIFDTTQEILKLSREKNIPSIMAANSLAEERILSVRKSKETR